MSRPILGATALRSGIVDGGRVGVRTFPVIYLDYNATAPLRPEVFAAMQPFLTEHWGNPSSSYTFGSKLKAEIEALLLLLDQAGVCASAGSARLADSDEPSHVIAR